MPILKQKIQAVATIADDGLLFPPERYPELRGEAQSRGFKLLKRQSHHQVSHFLKKCRSLESDLTALRW
jgi:hypothetical protein